MTDRELIASWELDILCAKNIGSVTLSKEFILAIDDFINRQKAEIERLQSMNQAKLDMIHDLRAEIERLEAQNGVYETCNARKQEAINSLENSLAISKKETKRYVENYKRQKKEIEEYRNIIERATEGIREVKAMLPRELAKERAEAVKEFAERLKEEIRDVAKIEFQDGYYYLIGVPLIDNLVKEFTEEKT